MNIRVTIEVTPTFTIVGELPQDDVRIEVERNYGEQQDIMPVAAEAVRGVLGALKS